jgi:lysozyme
MKCNEEGLSILKRYETLKLVSYKCPAGIWTIGWGHTGPEVGPNQSITADHANMLLRKDVEKFEREVSSLLKRKVTENQFSALVVFVFNIGSDQFKDSTLLLKMNSHAPLDHCAEEFLRWNKCKGQTLRGLTNRRKEEKNLFLKP